VEGTTLIKKWNSNSIELKIYKMRTIMVNVIKELPNINGGLVMSLPFVIQ